MPTKPPSDPGPPCKCGHGLNDHYLCGTIEHSRCLHGCGCKRFDPR